MILNNLKYNKNTKKIQKKIQKIIFINNSSLFMEIQN